jgi:CDP-L-myo-inositol myo-inositolphosphotransferase
MAELECLITAAGEGKRLRNRGSPKPLVNFLGLTLIERVLLTARESGIRKFYIVVGYQGEKIKEFLGDGKRYQVEISYLVNDNWKAGNGTSVYLAHRMLTKNFVLLQSDHVFEPRILKELQSEKLEENEVILAVDQKINSNKFVELEDVTRVKLNGRQILNIGKHLSDYNAYDTGIFLCSAGIFEGIAESIKQGDDTLSGGMRWLAERGRARAFPIPPGTFWIDIDNETAYRKAEAIVIKRLKKPTDGLISKVVNRPISTFLTRKFFLKSNFFSPGVLSFLCFFISILGALFILLGNYLSLLIGVSLAQLSSILDGCDGEVARLKFKKSLYGGWLDTILDRYSDGFILASLTFYLYSQTLSVSSLFLGFLAILGSFLTSYSAVKYDSYLEKFQSPKALLFRLGRDTRMFIIFLLGLFNQVFLSLLILSFLGHGEVIRRILVLRRVLSE